MVTKPDGELEENKPVFIEVNEIQNQVMGVAPSYDDFTSPILRDPDNNNRHTLSIVHAGTVIYVTEIVRFEDAIKFLRQHRAEIEAGIAGTQPRWNEVLAHPGIGGAEYVARHSNGSIRVYMSDPDAREIVRQIK